MNPRLMHRDRTLDLQAALPPNEQALSQDLELATLIGAMAGEDEFLADVARRVLLAPLADPAAITYRQDILKDCLDAPAVIRELYAIAVDAIEKERRDFWGLSSRYPSAILRRSVSVLEMFADRLKALRRIADAHGGAFASEGFQTLFAMLQVELADDYFAQVEAHLRELAFPDGVLISAGLGPGNKGANYVLRTRPAERRSWIDRTVRGINRMLGNGAPIYTYQLHPRDEAGATFLSELEGRGINLVADALAQSNEHILSFFTELRAELAFTLGCLNLYERLAHLGERVCFPAPAPMGERRHSFAGLYDVCLALTAGQRVVGNDVNADGKDLVVVTGANQGGKSTFLRSLGLAQLMMQAGVFVPAVSFSAGVVSGIFTHYKREEDATMESGKLDEDLRRMSDIADHIGPNALMLFNEPFAATNEREGSEIARQIVDALIEAGIRVAIVTHLTDLARSLYARGMPGALFLRAERRDDGERTFRIIEGEPLQTSYAEDVYTRIFAPGSTGPTREDAMQYRPCAGIVLVNAMGRVFLAQRRGYAVGGWQMPQGGIDAEETPRAAALRELAEEIGTDKAEIVAETAGWFQYDYPPDAVVNDRTVTYRGQRQKWFLMRFLGEDADIDLGTAHPEFGAWRWATPDQAIAEAVDFKRPIYEAVFEEFGRSHPDILSSG